MIDKRKSSLMLVAAALASIGLVALWLSVEAAPSVPCPGEDADVLQDKLSQRIYGISYRVDQETAVIELKSDDDPPETLVTSLDHIDATTYSLVESETNPTGMSAALIVAGCDGNDTVVQVYRDAANDGWLKDLQGTLNLGPTFRVGMMAVRSETFEIFCLERETGRVYRLTDSTGNGVPDVATDYEPEGGLPLEFAQYIVVAETRQLVVSSMAPPIGGETPVRIYRDLNGDGAVDSTENTTWGLFIGAAPVAMHGLMPSDESVATVGSPYSSVELWETNAEGEKVSEDPLVGLVGSGVLDEFGDGAIPITRTITSGAFYALFDTSTGKAGVAIETVADYSRGESITPEEIAAETSETVTVYGRGFSAATRVLLLYGHSGDMNIDLTPGTTLVSSEELSVVVPGLGTEYCGTATIRIEDDNTPLTESDIGFAFKPRH